jgi:hypothetical protein
MDYEMNGHPAFGSLPDYISIYASPESKHITPWNAGNAVKVYNGRGKCPPTTYTTVSRRPID